MRCNGGRVSLEVSGERRGTGVDLVQVEAALGVAGLVGGEGEAARLASDFAERFDNLLTYPAELFRTLYSEVPA
jgi:hypothetical protein